MQILKEKTFANVLAFIHNRNLSIIIVDYLCMTSEQFIQIHKDSVIKKCNDIEHAIPCIKSVFCIVCILGQVQYCADEQTLSHRLIPSVYNVCETCMPFVICETSKHLEDFRRHRESSSYTICYDICILGHYEYHFDNKK